MGGFVVHPGGYIQWGLCPDTLLATANRQKQKKILYDHYEIAMPVTLLIICPVWRDFVSCRNNRRMSLKVNKTDFGPVVETLCRPRQRLAVAYTVDYISLAATIVSAGLSLCSVRNVSDDCPRKPALTVDNAAVACIRMILARHC